MSDSVGRKKPKYRIMRWRKNDPIHNLYKAVMDYVRSNNGSIVVIGGVRIEEWPGDPAHKYHVAIGCLGKKPELKEPTNG